ncbi:hypothetical protein C8A01DRAFT_47117 [Parachaetomium inaequale]|uniref:DUF4604 domain-containing protein n=1 Tax=Parachaetomium inaequale TaxID=2588326 RepID=A0AAN6SRJ3_9PEZI|nr:hypothetical protein C8A01DRAFT_47117 [Parachaetomium inaequale]
MSHKITAKNLQYNTALPPFLARLRGEHASAADRDAPDPILAARRRPVKPRSGSAEAEDAPLVLDEHGNAVDVTVSADGTVREKEATTTADRQQEEGSTGEDKLAGAEAAAAAGEKLAGVGDQRRKRKIGKVVGADAEEEDGVGEKNGKGGEHWRSDTAGATTTAQDTKKVNSAAAAKAKTKKKAKKIKLSFGDDEG